MSTTSQTPLSIELATPWRSLMPATYWHPTNEAPNALALFDQAVANRGDSPAVFYFGQALSFSDVDQLSDKLAVAITNAGFSAGDRLATFMQNIPAFYICMIAAWKAGGALMPINPMNRARELTLVLDDAQPHTLVLETSLAADVYDKLPATVFRPQLVLTVSPNAHVKYHDPRVLPDPERSEEGSFESVLVSSHSHPKRSGSLSPSDMAFLNYTSGTTGVPKAAMISHRGATLAGVYGQRAFDIGRTNPVLAMAPLFHTTGLMMTMLAALSAGVGLIMSYRFHPEVILDAIRRHRPGFTAATPTAYLALSQIDGVNPDDFQSFRACGIGGATVSPGLKKRLEESFLTPFLPGYGMTETGGPVSLAPLSLKDQLPIDQNSSALSIGIPLPGVDMWIAGENGARLGPGEIGEIMVSAPGLMNGYWHRAEATTEAMVKGVLKTGDVGVMNQQGWFFLVDRKKEMIVSGGFKIWPREIEDVLMSHHEIVEAAVIGIPDSYRGENVLALIRFRAGSTATVEDIQIYCREAMAAYKRPREIRVVEELPKTGSGKVDRASLRASVQNSTPGAQVEAGGGG